MKNKNIYDLALGAMFTAIILIMAFTPLGYLRVGTLSISFMPIPVAIGAIILGPAWGTFFGLLFGITSCISGIMTGEGALMMAASVPLYIFVTIVPRIFVGLGSGAIYRMLQKKSMSRISVIAASVSAPVINTVLFLSAMIGCYYNTSVVQDLMASIPGATNVFMLAILLAGVNAVVELVACTTVSIAASSVIMTLISKTNKNKSEKA